MPHPTPHRPSPSRPPPRRDPRRPPAAAAAAAAVASPASGSPPAVMTRSRETAAVHACAPVKVARPRRPGGGRRAEAARLLLPDGDVEEQLAQRRHHAPAHLVRAVLERLGEAEQQLAARERRGDEGGVAEEEREQRRQAQLQRDDRGGAQQREPQRRERGVDEHRRLAGGAGLDRRAGTGEGQARGCGWSTRGATSRGSVASDSK